MFGIEILRIEKIAHRVSPGFRLWHLQRALFVADAEAFV